MRRCDSGSICASRTMAVTSSVLPPPATVSVSTVLRRRSLSSDVSRAFSSKVTAMGSTLRPYRTPGTFPPARTLWAPPLPIWVLTSTFTFANSISISFFACIKRRRRAARTKLDKQRADRVAVVDALDGLADHLRDGVDLDLGTRADVRARRDRVRDEELLDGRSVDAVDGGVRQHAVRRNGEHGPRALLLDGLRGGAHGAGRVDHVVDDDGVPALDVADDIDDLADIGR